MTCGTREDKWEREREFHGHKVVCNRWFVIEWEMDGEKERERGRERHKLQVKFIQFLDYNQHLSVIHFLSLSLLSPFLRGCNFIRANDDRRHPCIANNRIITNLSKRGREGERERDAERSRKDEWKWRILWRVTITLLQWNEKRLQQR